MKRIFSALKAVLTVFIAGVLLLVNTACSNASNLQAKAMGKEPNPPGQIQPYEGGMNNFRDVNPDRVDTTRADAKAKALRDSAERRINEKGVDSVEQYVENYRTGTPLGERVQNIGKDLRRGAENVGDDAQNITDRGSDKLQRNLSRAPGEINRIADDAKSNVKNAGQGFAEGVKDIGDKAGKMGQRAGEYSQDKASDAANSAKRAIDKAA